ncbi:histidine phosphatase family protein [Loigolactobacillus bifermentans]|uniref:Phosphoglycerate mutase n=1 Tax=Loigolactobacillus bifermentans DSM 20003 TaxID=1423726 RepID=A0A0R1GLZ0_9LACO|nr:histidine phosphatase family protein [Loigolactobacillus bifermentans]KRK35125.1 phosphoglycerate mutase [Loigolactobacillus bifermentans DSM 20003]QGG59212.1 histidine phosphatase family protein [Loigolactobacillus bifermentans]
MTTLYFVRHGKTQWNLEGRYQGGHGDSPLLPESYQEIKELAHFLAPEPIRHIYSSPLLRAKTTALELDRQLPGQIPITIDDRLREFNLGKMEGMRFTDVATQFPAQLHAFRHAPADYDPTVIAGEGFPELVARMRPAVDEVAQADHGTGCYLFVSHGAALTALLQTLIGTPLAELRSHGGLSNTSLTTLETIDHGEHYRLVKWNDVHYLSKTPEASDTI